MKTVKFKVTELNNDYMEKTIIQKISALDDVFDVSLDPQTKELSLSVQSPSDCDSVVCRIQEMGYSVCNVKSQDQLDKLGVRLS